MTELYHHASCGNCASLAESGGACVTAATGCVGHAAATQLMTLMPVCWTIIGFSPFFSPLHSNLRSFNHLRNTITLPYVIKTLPKF